MALSDGGQSEVSMGVMEGASQASVVTVPRRWLKFLRRVMGLSPGRYQLVLSVQADRCDWTVVELGRIERE